MFKEFKKLIRILINKHYRYALFKEHVAAGVEHEKLLGNLLSKKIATFVDIGANRGQFTLIARHLYPNSKIYSFEPLQKPAETFEKIFVNDTNIKLYRFAVGSEETERVIHISYSDDSSSLLPITDLQSEIYPGTLEKETRSIYIKPLYKMISGSEIRSPAFLKIDVQGYEKQVLEGCISLLSLFSYLYVECSFIELYRGQALAHEIISWLYQNYYILNGVYNIEYDKTGKAIQGDFFFLRN